MSALDMIIQWARDDLYDWQQNSVRRLLTQGFLSVEDENEIFAMLKERKGIIDPKNPAKKPQSIKKGDISGAPSQKVKMTLKCINNLRNVNAIPNRANLAFGHQGLNVIYGENATGKSGYARVLKRACKARDIEERLLPNVFEPKRGEPAEASFKVSINDEPDKEVPWQDGKKEEAGILSNICVFDSKCARVIVDENNETSYVPYGATVFPDLVDLMKAIRSKIEKEKPKPVKLEYQNIPATTKAGKLISDLTHETAPAVIVENAGWEEGDETKLDQLKKQISDIESSDPGKVALRLRNTKDRINHLIKDISLIDETLSTEKEENIKQAITSVNAAEKAHALASQEPLPPEPLKGVGEKAWQGLYNTAKEYSTSFAYPGKEFPVTEGGSLCVLCMQPLEAPARERMQRFKNFMEKSTKKAMEKAQRDLGEVIEEIEEMEFPKPESYKDILDEFRDKYPEAIKQMEEYIPAMQQRAKGLIRPSVEKTMEPSPQVPAAKPNPKEAIGAIAKQLEAEAQEIEKTANPEELVKKTKEFKELEARKLFSQKRDEILKYLEQLKLAKKYDECYAETQFTGITNKGKRIIKAALTPQLKAGLGEELKDLGATHLPLKLVASGEEGQTLHRIELETPQPLKTINLSEILSEGEHCVIALAGFLAELQVADHECPIVLDDPVCSLDHKYMRRIAKRLVREAEKRQVIVFTHDIAFLLELKDKAAESDNCSFTAQTVCRLDSVGKCMDGLPWHSMEVKERLKYLREELASFKDLHPSNMPEYNRKAAGFYSLLRETWEAFVEEKLLNKTIVRHGAEVLTQRLKSVSVSNDDYKKIHIEMHNCSTWMTGHDKSKALSEDRPSPMEISKDIGELAQYSNEIGTRNEDLRNIREEMLKPKQANIG